MYKHELRPYNKTVTHITHFRTNLNYEDFSLVGYNVMFSVENQPTLQRNISPIFSVRRISQAKNQHKAGGKHMLVSCLIYPSTLKMEATSFRSVV
jgi:hypothetical protein